MLNNLFRKSKNFTTPLSVIAVGNLSVGGTGKSVFVEWLVTTGLFKQPLILFGGYKSLALKVLRTYVVSDGKKIFGDALWCGDEPFQLAQKGVCVAIGKNRTKALNAFIEKFPTINTDIVILDDGYQTLSIGKNFTILLVDARHPLENSFLFPAGPLRELDYARADAIILTHADRAIQPLNELKKKYFPLFDSEKILAGRHRFVGFIDSAGVAYEHLAANKKAILFAAIAKPDNLPQTLPKNINFCFYAIFPDHHSYSQDDINFILSKAIDCEAQMVITTEKDWVKIAAYQQLFEAKNIACFRVKIEFEFLYSHEYDVFKQLLCVALQKQL